MGEELDRKARYRAKPGTREKERDYARQHQREKRAAMTPSEKDAHLAARREYLRDNTEQQLKAKRNQDDWQRRQAERGYCICCVEKATAGRYCLPHWFAMIGRARGLTGKNGGLTLIRRIWDEQGGICDVTGDHLVPGVNASLDHRIPVSRGGDCSRENLRWIVKMANYIKSDSSEEDLLTFCRKVVAHDERRRRGTN